MAVNATLTNLISRRDRHAEVCHIPRIPSIRRTQAGQ